MRLWIFAFAAFSAVLGLESSVFSEKLTLTNSQEGSKFGASFDFFTQRKNGEEVVNLVVGAPKFNVQPGYTGRVYSYEIDKQCTSETCHESPLLFEGNQGTLMNNIFRDIKEENLLVHNKFLGATIKIDESGALWFCDPRATAAAMCDRRDHEDLKEGETRCKTLTKTQDMESSLERHDFPIGSCYYVRDIKQQIDALKNGNVESISWISPCFTYLTPLFATGGHSLPTIYWKNGTQEYGRYGRNYDQGMMSMSCQFGASISELDSTVFVGAPKNHNQGNTFAFNTRKFPDPGKVLLVAGMQQVEKSVLRKEFLTFSKPEYSSESMTPDFIKRKEAGGRRGSNVGWINLGDKDFLLEVEDRGLNDNHKRTGCVHFLVSQNSIWGEDDINSYGKSARALKSKSTRVCGTFSHESFGSAIQVIDINGDGRDDLIVGAPHYSEKRKYDIGRIFIYIQQPDGRLDDINPKILLGVDQEGRFGSAIEHVGDQDGDGFNDVVISSPYAVNDKDNAKSSLGKLYLIYGGQFTMEAAEEGSAEDFCLFDKTDIGEVSGYSPTGDFKALGSKMKYKTGEENQLFVTAGESDMIYLFNLKPMFKLELYWGDESVLDREANLLEAEICVRMTDKPVDAPNSVTVEVSIELDSRLVGNTIMSEIQIRTKRSSEFCEKIKIKISEVLQDCNTGPFELAVVGAKLNIKNQQDMFGYTFGCKSRFPRHFVEIEGDGSNTPKINIDVEMDRTETTVQSINLPAERLNGQLTVRLDNALLMRPSIVMEFEEGQLSFDMTSDNDWYVDACPNDPSCGNTYFGRKCIFKSLGFAMNEGDRQRANFAFDVKADGTDKELRYSAKLFSCGKCQEIRNCGGTECSSAITVVQEKLLDSSTARLKVSPDSSICNKDNDNETGAEIISISVSSLISGVSPVKAGNLAIVTTITEAYIFENPCKEETGVVSGTITMRKPTCESENGKLTIRVESEQDLLPSLLSSVEVNINLMKKLSTPECRENSTITSQMIISSPILDSDEIVSPKSVKLTLTNYLTTAGMKWWIVIGLCGFVLLLVVLLVVFKTHEDAPPEMQTATTLKPQEAEERVY